MQIIGKSQQTGKFEQLLRIFVITTLLPKILRSVCRRSGHMVNNAYGKGSGPIWLNNVQCMGNENNLETCLHDGWGSYTGGHANDVSIVCSTSFSNTVGKLKHYFCVSR